MFVSSLLPEACDSLITQWFIVLASSQNQLKPLTFKVINLIFFAIPRGLLIEDDLQRVIG